VGEVTRACAILVEIRKGKRVFGRGDNIKKDVKAVAWECRTFCIILLRVRTSGGDFLWRLSWRERI